MSSRVPAEPFQPGISGADDKGDDYALTFAPVPGRARADGWTAERQRAFIVALHKLGVVASAARSVGMTGVSAYRLRRRANAEAFATAWDRALDEARIDAFHYAMERATEGATKPRFYRGRFVGTVHSFDDRLALAALRYADRTGPAKGYK